MCLRAEQHGRWEEAFGPRIGLEVTSRSTAAVAFKTMTVGSQELSIWLVQFSLAHRLLPPLQYKDPKGHSTGMDPYFRRVEARHRKVTCPRSHSWRGLLTLPWDLE